MKPGAREIVMLPIESLKPYGKNPRKHSDAQVIAISRSIQKFGFTAPLLINRDDAVIAGHGRLRAAMLLHMAEVPCIRIEGLSAAEQRALVIADNQLAQQASWDADLLASEIQEITQDGFDVALLGFSEDELALIEQRGALNEEGPTVREPRNVTCPECGHEFNPKEKQR